MNAELLKLFYGELEAQGGLKGTVHSSSDDILQRYQSPAMQALFGFISDAVFEAASTMNGPIWQQIGVRNLQIQVVGAWFQM